ncbi:hypothetical protein NUU61_009140 [Penicillium alfredii]|uniref:Nudix hydrolase domain-containing protein n=1 Tax=Penicillium alfredii TaxID=1506179 RepID=A0A9W9EMJ4_9EURO|nr:uncharacterized protein NUU61_009140 [Penicillium alfredii]KAJ5084561.1 hypothetical protein NUU61_009140 [Penicillium alfredii]
MERSLHFSDQFVISCGTVSLNLHQAKVLLIRWRKTGEVFLPKGRKNIGETLHDAATRETFEETGFQVTCLPLPITTLATSPVSSEIDTSSQATTEPVAVSQRVTNNQLKIIYWFAATGDSEAVPELGTQQTGEDFEAIWTGIGHVGEVLTFDDDKQIAQAVIHAASHLINMKVR